MPPSLVAVVRGMPTLSHWADRSLPFRADESQVLPWLTAAALRDPQFKQRLLQSCRNYGLIVFDHATKLWQGSDRLEAPEHE